MPAGRPTDYTPELLEKAWWYADSGWNEVGDPVPTVAGLACELGISRDTCYEWEKHEDKEFSDILRKIAQTQERHLVKGGLVGGYNAAISKMMLTRHGYSDRIEQDHTTNGKDLPSVVERIIVTPDGKAS